MLHIHRSERADRLVEGLAEVLRGPPADAFAPEVVAVPAKGVERWVSQRLSHVLGVTAGEQDGVCANVRFPHPSSLVAEVLGAAAGIGSVSADGRLLGLNTNRLGDGFYLAIPADQTLRTRVDALARGESTARVRLGIGVVPAHVARRLRRAVGLPEADGLLIRQVEDDSPASRAGLAQGDLIVQAAGQPVRGVDDLFAVLETAADDEIELTILRGTEERTVQVRLDEAAGNGPDGNG